MKYGFVGNNKAGWVTKDLPYRLQALIVDSRGPAVAGISGKSGSYNGLNISNNILASNGVIHVIDSVILPKDM